MESCAGYGTPDGYANASGNTGEIENLTMTGLSAELADRPSIDEMRMGAKLNVQPDIQIKYETPSTANLDSATANIDSATLYHSLPPASPKRARSDTHETAEKRQRIEPEASSELKRSHDLDSLLKGVSASVTQQYQPRDPSLLGIQNVRREDAIHTRGFTSDPYLSMRILSLPVLDSLSTQILSTFARGPYLETIRIVTDPESELGQAYAALKSLFDDTKKIYSKRGQGPFLSADDLGIDEPKHRATIRTTNVATFAASIFGGQDIGFWEMNDQFIDIFTPEAEALDTQACKLYLNLKTQMYLSFLMQEEQDRTKEDILEDLFPPALDRILASRRPSAQLTESELNFLNTCKTRREYFMNEPSDVESIQVLSEKFSWDEFLQDLGTHLNVAYGPIVDPYMRRHALTAPASPVRGPTQSSTQDQFSMQIGTTQDITGSKAVQSNLTTQESKIPFDQLQRNGGSRQPYHAPTQNSSSQSQYNKESIPYHTQSAPTQVLYERARQAAVAKSHPGTTRRPGLPSQRRPWSSEEENTLMAGLDQVKGPHWSQILALYGTDGTVNKVLKDRNQVQLKDKARNLKLFFLKSNIEVPYYLKTVTGELKTRAPSQAARKEAEERAKFQGAEAAGIMTLASGMQNQRRESYVSDTPGGPSPGDFSSPREQFHVTESENQDPFQQCTPPPQLAEDEQLRQTLLAATTF
ncbi:Telomeric DNA-binding factor [Lachnellula willkommii]|uniref:Telomeric DNA-binding factor n=1 Tax=Lachnellula willkommii TaxID=215461 RepID=A0A559MK57_9HELO|nr:Telomeric DNA-binding factor [Lachnellula willkommii]